MYSYNFVPPFRSLNDCHCFPTLRYRNKRINRHFIKSHSTVLLDRTRWSSRSRTVRTAAPFSLLRDNGSLYTMSSNLHNQPSACVPFSTSRYLWPSSSDMPCAAGVRFTAAIAEQHSLHSENDATVYIGEFLVLLYSD